MTDAIIKSYLRLFPLVAVLFLTACATRQEAPRAPVELPGEFTRAGQRDVPDTWWKSFDDRQLDRLVAQALEDNLSLRASYQRLRQARAVADRQGAALFPSLDATATAERQQTDTTDTDIFSAGLSASYEVDLWGRVQSLSEAESLRASATLADFQAAAISLSGEIANTWFQLVEQRAQLALAESQLETNENVLTVIESRFAMGQNNSADVLRQRQLVSASRERLSNIEGETGVLQHQLAVLLGRSPGQGDLPEDDTLPALPPLPETGVPAELVQRRPDLQQAWRVVQAADRDLAAAISNRFPRFSIEASISSQANDAGNLFDNWLATLAGNLVVPLVDGGERRAEVRRSEAVLEELVQEYGQAVLVAIREVEDALVREQQQRRRLQSLNDQSRLADTTYRQLRNQYLNGAVSYIDVLTALQEKQDLQRTILSTRQQLLTTRVALYRALAGSIDSVKTPENDET
ncbi:efflux transporter outer membrane subunit [Marinobacter orientalis]|uniref:Efflux transporter outer membrane subunit n=1 Tax=Marinobacter orientalis TaxID=1928859 RepID=A0A7Y0WTV7_9GAMM|nr:efflux transporter outer membrane subunit [Marinobacter orientalis]NMT65110.1 efflux transporter outer membrane subunit [Marinobacter orientalis]TGX48943.1 efflux transporter outer membrane subunit [Marinobacter orientalis]